MATALKLGPADHGRPMSLEEFASAAYEDGYHYELIDGELYVSPQPDASQGKVEHWVFVKLLLYSLQHPEVLNYVHPKARVFVPGRRGTTNPEPDVAAYRDFPLHLPARRLRWQDVSPVLVVEVVSPDDPDKDLVRNVELYLAVPSIKEYWLLDARDDPDQPTLTAHRRHGGRWRTTTCPYGSVYTTRLLPDFQLIIDPRA